MPDGVEPTVIAAAKIPISADLEQWNRDREQVERDLTELADKFSVRLGENLDGVISRLEQRLDDIFDRAGGGAARGDRDRETPQQARVYEADDQDDRRRDRGREGGPTMEAHVTLDADTKRKLDDILAGVAQLGIIFAQR